MKKIRLLFILLYFISFSLSAESKGPLLGKNYYLPFVPYYTFPGMAASPGKEHSLNFTLANYFIQDIVTEFHLSGTTLLKERFIDYEGYIFEPTVSYNLKDNLEFGLTTRLHAYYGGFWDPVIEGFHDLFGFANGGREYYPQNDVYIDIHTDRGIDLSLNHSTMAPGDTDLFAKWSFFSFDLVDMALFAALKVPTGAVERIGGSGYMDFGFQLLLDFYLLDRLTFYLQNGVIIPGQRVLGSADSPELMYSLQAAFEFIVSPVFSLITQFRLNTSPIREGSVITQNISYSVKLHQPMTNILFGMVFTSGEYRLQFDFEEDAFTNSGADLILNFTVSRSFLL